MIRQGLQAIVRGVLAVLLAAGMLLFPAGNAAARQVVDMVGRRIELPESLQRVYVASPPENHLACVIDPSLMVGLNLPLKERDLKYLPPQLWHLPVIGGFYGLGHTPNLEVLLRSKPQLVICWQKNAIDAHFDDFLKRTGIPVAYMTLEALQDYPRDIRAMGNMLDRPRRAEELAAYAEATLRQILPKVAAIPEAERVRVYYAEGADGLSTDGRGTWHAELIDLAGGLNVHEGDVEDLYGMEKVSMEQVLLYRPDVILVQDPGFFKRIFSSPQWRRVPAVKNRRVYLIPRIPFNWFDRPPCFMRLLGLKWLAQTLYPQRFHLEMDQETREFYRLFLQSNLSAEDIRSILENAQGGSHE
ncbi:ABC transporter, periplasmic metal-binding protein, TroA_e family [Syntrophotalea carbinolica DSM 2380]|uniref:ABC transporter, periplasmic metal-binding protein, TroA_e family n=1 Tax=Syntrophotalea carbinolica (strain DSM 2380 / NBRC 103641 / GraBd1) TaxID=338963 RepID=Q3A878_SYNC1|nr:ABC transporter substrate-binding protein [Syntrophotalea carbinolica]ABA87414.1 ABC transporter, periplasmic metal-binding protein, TroA_e family [Syntrophotalea carbinolica DSM 2380]